MKKRMIQIISVIGLFLVLATVVACVNKTPDFETLNLNEFVMWNKAYRLPCSVNDLPLTMDTSENSEYTINGVEFQCDMKKYYPVQENKKEAVGENIYMYFDTDDSGNIKSVHLNRRIMKNEKDIFCIGGITVGMSESKVVSLKGEGLTKHYSGYEDVTPVKAITYYAGEDVTIAVEYDTDRCVKSITAMLGDSQPSIT